MCLFQKPDMPATPEPTKPQDAKMAEAVSSSAFDPSVSAARLRMAQAGGSSNTLLTGASGIENSQLNIGRSTLLGM